MKLTGSVGVKHAAIIKASSWLIKKNVKHKQMLQKDSMDHEMLLTKLRPGIIAQTSRPLTSHI